MEIPFDKSLEFEYGVAARLTPLVRRVVARNPGPFTFHGTGTYIVGEGEVAVIDPGRRTRRMSRRSWRRSTAKR